MKIAIIEPFYTGSHKKWVDDYQKNSKYEIDTYSLPGKYWKWRMHGAAITLANQVSASNKYYDIFIISDFTNLSLFKSLVKNQEDALFYLYFHENQLTYPWSPTDIDVSLERDNLYAFINYSSALVADKVFFNSTFHKENFLTELHPFLQGFPDFNNYETIQIIEEKSSALSLAVSLPSFSNEVDKIPNTILWNHRWEYDKNPKDFFNILKELKSRNIIFQLIILGESTGKHPAVFDWAKEFFNEEIIHFGYVSSSEEYWNWLRKSSIIPVTSIQDFFGISVIEAMHANVFPLLPNRIVYPEHVPSDYLNDHLYGTNDDLLEKLVQLLTHPFSIVNTSEWVKKYSWKNSIDKYDTAFGKEL